MEAKAKHRAERREHREERIRAAVRRRAERQARLEKRVSAGGRAAARFLGPIVVLGHRGLSKLAPYTSRALLAAVRLPAAAIASLLDFFIEFVRSARRRLGPILAGIGAWVQKNVTPVNTVATMGLGCAVALGVAQFIDYTGIAVGEPLYQDDAANVAPVPLTELEKTGSAHYYALLPLALAAGVLIVLTRLGRWRLGRVVALLGAIGLAVTLLIDRPQALDAGPLADAYAGSEAKLLDGYWAQLVASAGLILFGPLLGEQVRRDASGDRDTRRRERARRRPGGKSKFVGSTQRREASV